MTKDSKIALFDLDGTLADFDGAIRLGMMKLASPDEIVAGLEYREKDGEPEHLTARRRLIKRVPGFWRELHRLPLGFELLQHAIDVGFNIQVLTKAPRTNFRAWTEKVEWCHAHLDVDKRNIQINLVEDKGLVYGRMLVDDWPPYIMRWLEHRPRGQVIMPAQPWNQAFRHPQVFRCDSFHPDIRQARELMVAAFER